MAGPEDQTLEVLQELRTGFDAVKATLAEHTARFDHLDEQIEAMADYVTFAMGKGGENRADIEKISEDLKALTARVKALEEAK
ncbi:MAG: hypothetical protein GVY06_03765 [Alphaproteobacteria bacterium]|jgi:outer membrane murein-binding lipoprotein Lpp|nr:hypothetical protein [Alphaproteobacteria bacterium]